MNKIKQTYQKQFLLKRSTIQIRPPKPWVHLIRNFYSANLQRNQSLQPSETDPLLVNQEEDLEGQDMADSGSPSLRQLEPRPTMSVPVEGSADDGEGQSQSRWLWVKGIFTGLGRVVLIITLLVLLGIGIGGIGIWGIVHFR